MSPKSPTLAGGFFTTSAAWVVGSFSFNFSRSLHAVFQMAAPFCIPSNSVQRLQFFAALPTLVVFCFVSFLE